MEWTPVIDWLASHGVRILIVVIIFGVLIFILRRVIPHAVRATVTRRMADRPEEEIEKRIRTLSPVFMATAWVVFILSAVLIILSEIGINIAPLLAGLGIVGLAVGFGAQYLIRDLLAGIFILMENQYRVGDVVRIADVAGIVEDINLRRTTLRDLDGIVHVVPNG